MSFINLSSDLLLLISDHFDRQYDLYALSLVCQNFHDLFINQLYLFNIKYRRSTALFWAAEDGRTLSLRRILTLRRDNSRIDDEFPVDFFYSKTYRGKTPLYLALSRGHHDAVKLLLEYGADPLLRCPLGLTPLYAACLSGKDEVVEIISKHIQDLPNYLVDLKKGFSPLHMACRYGISKSARQFLLHGVDVNAKDKRGRTALRIALTTIFRGFSEATQRKMKPSHTAIFETVRVLIEYGAHPYLSTESLVFLGKSRMIPTAANIGALNMDRDVRALFKPALVSKKHSLLLIDNLNKPSLMNSGNDRCKCLKFSPYEFDYLRGVYHQIERNSHEEHTLSPCCATDRFHTSSSHYEPSNRDPRSLSTAEPERSEYSYTDSPAEALLQSRTLHTYPGWLIPRRGTPGINPEYLKNVIIQNPMLWRRGQKFDGLQRKLMDAN